jgi:hypothetical protein
MIIGEQESPRFTEGAASVHNREALLARVGAAAITGYCGSTPLPDEALATWDETCGTRPGQAMPAWWKP